MAQISLNHLEKWAASSALEQDKGWGSSGLGLHPGVPSAQPHKHTEMLQTKTFSKYQDANKGRQHENKS